MIKENDGQWVVIDGVVREADALDCVPWHEGRMVYEVIRVIDGVPLFFEDHYRRMRASYEAVGGREDLLDEAGLLEQIRTLLRTNGIVRCNVKFISFVGNPTVRLAGYISKTYYPSAEMVRGGVPTGLLWQERENPNVKELDVDYKERAARIKSHTGVFELLLVDRDGHLTEGSMSNLFFVKNGTVFTAPGDKVLKGITRQYVFQACRDAGYPVEEKLLSADDLPTVEGAFLSGTSPKVLPIASIGDLSLASGGHPAIVAVRDAYDRLLQAYIDARKT